MVPEDDPLPTFKGSGVWALGLYMGDIRQVYP